MSQATFQSSKAKSIGQTMGMTNPCLAAIEMVPELDASTRENSKDPSLLQGLGNVDCWTATPGRAIQTRVAMTTSA